MKTIGCIQVGHLQALALNEKELTEDIILRSGGHAYLNKIDVSRYFGIRKQDIDLMFPDLPREYIGKKPKIHAKNLARYLLSARTFGKC